VQRRFEERMVTIARLADGGPDPDGATLEGVFVAGREGAEAVRGAVVAPPHPLYGGSMDSPVVNEVAWAAGRAGLASLRFNWRGAGASTGEPSGDPDDADADYAAALAHLADTVEGPLVAAGYSFGAAAALRSGARHRRVDRLVLVAPPPSLLDAGSLRAARRRMLVVAGAEDRLAPADALREAVAAVDGATFHEIAGADHFFGRGLAELGRTVSAWLGTGAVSPPEG
jgi:alpha/beta superfamily hydrolase